MKRIKIRTLLISLFLVVTFLTGCPLGPQAYTVEFIISDGTKVDSELVNINTKVTKPNSLEKIGYVLDDWYLDDTYKKIFNFDSLITKDITLYSRWNKVYTLKFYTQLTDENSFVKTVDVVGDNKTVKELPPNPTKDGYIFDSWTTKINNLETPFSLNTIINDSYNIYAKWTAEEHILSFESNGSSGTMNPITLKTDELIKLPENSFIKPASFTEPGYQFAGWATNSTGKVVYENLEEFTMGPSHMTLYAKWGISREELQHLISQGKDVTKVDTSLITDLSYVFGNKNDFNQDISDWDVSNVITMQGLFYWKSNFNQDISRWDVSKVENMSMMFSKTNSFNQDISTWDVSSVKDMNSMFKEAPLFNQDISSWDVSNVKDMSSMFESASAFNQNLSSWNVSNVKDMSRMFYYASKFNGQIFSLELNNVEKMERMFYNANLFNQDISAWNVSNVNDMESMFERAYVFNQDISNWSVNKVADMESMFEDAKSFNQDISLWTVNNVKDMRKMFKGALVFNQDLTNWNVGKVTKYTEFNLNSVLTNENMPKFIE